MQIAQPTIPRRPSYFGITLTQPVTVRYAVLIAQPAIILYTMSIAQPANELNRIAFLSFLEQMH